MFIKKVTNNKKGITYLTYRLVKSQRINGNPNHINILEMGSLSEIPLEKHKALAERIEQLMVGDVLLFSDQDALIEEWSHYFYRKLIGNKFHKTRGAKAYTANPGMDEMFVGDSEVPSA